MRRYYYVGTLVFVFTIPAAIAGFFLSQLVSLSALIPFVVLVTVIGSVLDVWATRHGRKDSVWLWQFHSAQTLGIQVFGLPIEEYLFYIASSLYVVIMWEGLKLMLYGTSPAAYAVMGATTLWTLGAIGLLYLRRPKGDIVLG